MRRIGIIIIAFLLLASCKRENQSQRSGSGESGDRPLLVYHGPDAAERCCHPFDSLFDGRRSADNRYVGVAV